MENLKIQEFEMNSEAMRKVHGGAIVTTSGVLYSDIDVWCESDSGCTVTQTIIAAYDCCVLGADGNCQP